MFDIQFICFSVAKKDAPLSNSNSSLQATYLVVLSEQSNSQPAKDRARDYFRGKLCVRIIT